jgi:hypothetical protein
MKSLKQLEKEMNELKDFQANARHSIIKDAETVLRRKLTRSKEFKKLLSELETTRQLTDVTYDEFPHRWIRADFSLFIDETNHFQREIFQACLDSMDTFTIADFENDSLTTSEGPCIMINDSGDREDGNIWLEGKLIIDRDEYRDENGDLDESRRNELIEAYMTASGYFPSVVSVGQCGINGYVNTQPIKKAGAK